MRILVLVMIGCCLSVLSAVGCHKGGEKAAALSPEREFDPNSPALSARDIDLIRYLLQQADSENSKQHIYFLTLTPMSEWGDHGMWRNVPDAIEAILPRLKTPYRDADEAYLKDGSVLIKGSDSSGWMRWITIQRWISDSEVEVEEGVWCCDLGGGASTSIYSKVNGEWEFSKSVSSWVS